MTPHWGEGSSDVRPLHGRGLKTVSVAVSKSTEHDITLTSFVADLPHPGLSNFYMMCEIDAKEGAKSLMLICAFALDISQENERGALGAEYFCRDTVGKVCITIHPGKKKTVINISLKMMSHVNVSISGRFTTVSACWADEKLPII